MTVATGCGPCWTPTRARSSARPCRRRTTPCSARATAGSSGADALVEMARRSLGTVTPLARREAFLAVFHVPVGSSPGHLHGGPVLPDRLRRQLLCDGRGVVVGVRHGRPVEPRSVHPDRADPAAAADRGARSGVSGAGVHGDPGADPPPAPLGGRRRDRAVEPGRAVPPSPSPAPRWRPADRRRPRAARRAGVRRSLRPRASGPGPSRPTSARRVPAWRRPSGSPARGAIRRVSGSQTKWVDFAARPDDAGADPAGVIRGERAPVRSAR